MKVKLKGYDNYDYVDRKGVRHQGSHLFLESIEPVSDDDGNGNFKIGTPVESRYFRFLPCTREKLDSCIEHDVDLVYEKRFGCNYDELVDIVIID